MAADAYKLYGCPGWGSSLVECFLALAGVESEFYDVCGFDTPGPARDRLLKVNALAQVPTIILPDQMVMTESAAIALLLSERFPDASLAPLAGTLQRPLFLRRLIWIVANIYPTFTYFDYPERWVASEAESFGERVLNHRKSLWLLFERDLDSKQWVLDHLSALDVYVAVMSHWRPGRAWFEQYAPRLSAIARNAADHATLGPVLLRNFPGAGA